MIQLTHKKLSVINPDILLIYGNLEPTTQKEYYNIKINTILQTKSPGASVATIDNANISPTIKVAKPEDCPDIPKELEANINCLRNIISKEYPLLPDEVILSSRITFLEEAFNTIPKRTIVYEYNTNKATLYYLIKNIGLNEEYTPFLQETVHEELSNKSYSGLDALSLKISAGSIAVSIGKGIASGMLSAIGGAIADAILDKIFPPEIPDYFDQVYKQITKIVKKEIQQSKIDTISGAITSVIQKINNEYVPALSKRNLQNKEDRQFLYGLLQKYDQTFISGANGMLGTLQQEGNASPGFTVFMLGASLQLSLYQEMANVDPTNKSENGEWNSPLESSYGVPQKGTVAKTADGFVKFAKETYKNIMTSSDNAVKVEKFVVEKSSIVGQTLVTDRTYYCRIVDDGIATNRIKNIGPDDKHGNNPKYDAYVSYDLPDYRRQKRNNLDLAMNYPLQVIEAWEQLINQPIKLK